MPIATVFVSVFAALLCLWPHGAVADKEDSLAERITADVMAKAFPGADGVDAVVGAPGVAPVRKDDQVVGYLLSTFDTKPIGGFTGVPFDIIVGIDLDARVQGVALIEHHEPIISPNAIPEERLLRVFEQLRGFRVAGSLRSMRASVDSVSGATVSAELMRSAILSSARKIAGLQGLIDGAGEDRVGLDMDRFEPQSWEQLLASGAVAQKLITAGELAATLAREQAPLDPDQTVLDVYAAIASPLSIGRNFFGDSWHTFHLSQLDHGSYLLVIASRGAYRLFGLSSHTADRYPQARVVQDGRRYALSRANKLGKPSIIAEGAPLFQERFMFWLSAKDGFDPLRPWSLEFDIEASALGESPSADPATFALTYQMPLAYLSGSDFALEEAGFIEPVYRLGGLVRQSRLSDWQLVWVERVQDIGVLVVLLVVLTAILLFQNTLSRSRRQLINLRIAFLALVLVWLGWAKDGQLTTLNVVGYAQAAFNGGDLTFLLLDPLIFLLSIYVFATLLLFGRGVYCGWLCPFGALQELSNRLARLFRVPQITMPAAVNERLWIVKYVFAVAIFAIAAWSMSAANAVAEIEPFKTAIVVMFVRDWPYVVYATLLIAIGLSIERFFCRYLCPLGGVLSIFGRAHVLHWLRRRPECGTPCTICRASCPVDAIQADGAINMNECFQCLDCQVDYYDDRICPPLVTKRRRAGRALAST